ncbi:hypothetical protein ES703_45800 [subsurface metagenome]
MRVFLDYDSNSSWFTRTGPMWDDLLELIRFEAQRLAATFPLGDIAVIKRSDNGWHLLFPRAHLTREEEESVMWSSLSHFGHIKFSVDIGDTTLRVSRKPSKNSHKTWLREIIRLA